MTEIQAAPNSKEVNDFESVYAEGFDYVWHSLRRLGVAAADVEDLTHDVFVVVHRKLGEYDSSRPLRPWLFGIAYRVAADFRRLARHREERLDAAPDAFDVAQQDEALEAKQNRTLLAAALDALELDRRALVVMHDVDGCSMPEIAETLGLPLNTLYSRLRLARDQLALAITRLRATKRGLS